MDKTGRILMQAAALIEERGLAKWILRDDCGHLCARGAINAVVTGDAREWGGWEHKGPHRRLDKFLGMPAPTFNNADDTDKTAVICALTGAAMMEID